MPNGCPTARIVERERAVAAGSVVIVSGAATLDPDGDPLFYDWSVLEQPDGSDAVFVERFDDSEAPDQGGPDDDPSTPTTQLWLTTPGDYSLQLIVTEDKEGSECTSLALARVVVQGEE